MTATDTATGRRQWWRQPWLHFLLIGAALFAAFQWMERRQGADSKTILVDRDALLTYMQYRARTFDPARSAETLDRLDESELAALVDNYVLAFKARSNASGLVDHERVDGIGSPFLE